MSNLSTKKTSSLTIFLTEAEKSKLISMAQTKGQEVDKFILSIVLPKAKEILKKHQL